MFQLPHKHKVVIAGNHELGFDPERKMRNSGSRSGHLGTSPHPLTCASPPEGEEEAASTEYNIRSELTSCTYLEDSATEICGLKIYGNENIECSFSKVVTLSVKAESRICQNLFQNFSLTSWTIQLAFTRSSSLMDG